MNAKQLLKNPIVTSAMRYAKDQGREFGIISTLIICVNVLNDYYGFSVDELENFYRRVDDVADSLNQDLITLTDIAKALKQFYGFELPIQDLFKIFGKDIPEQDE